MKRYFSKQIDGMKENDVCILFYIIESKDGTRIVERVAYFNSSGIINVPSRLKFLDMDGSIPVFSIMESLR